MLGRAAFSLVFALAILAMGGCAQVPKPEPAPATATPQSWQGKLGYRLEASEGERAQAGSATFDLQGTSEQGQLQLTSPLGTTLASANWGPAGLNLFDGRETVSFASLDDLGAALGQRLGGTPLPLAALFDWLQGQPWPGATHEIQAPGQFLQLGWRVEHQAPRLRLRHDRLTLTMLIQAALS